MIGDKDGKTMIKLGDFGWVRPHRVVVGGTSSYHGRRVQWFVLVGVHIGEWTILPCCLLPAI